MANKVGWSDKAVQILIYEGELNPIEIFVLITRVLGWTVKRQALAVNYSERQIARIIHNIQEIYDDLQTKHNRELPIRNKESETEKYLDEN